MNRLNRGNPISVWAVGGAISGALFWAAMFDYSADLAHDISYTMFLMYIVQCCISAAAISMSAVILFTLMRTKLLHRKKGVGHR